MGEVFTRDAFGVYHSITGELLVDFGMAPYTYINGDTEKLVLTDMNDFDRATSDIYDYRGVITLSRRDLKRTPIAEEPPLMCKARKAAAAFFASVLRDTMGYAKMSRNIPRIDDTIDMEYILSSDRLKERLKELELDIIADINRLFNGDSFKDLYMHFKSGIYIVDVGVDIRIRDYYLRLFDEQDRENDRDSEKYEGFRS